MSKSRHVCYFLNWTLNTILVYLWNPRSLYIIFSMWLRQKFQDYHIHFTCPISKNSTPITYLTCMPWENAAYSSPFLNTFWRRGKGGVVLVFFLPTYAFLLDTGILRETEYLFNSRAFLQMRKITMILEYLPWLLGSNYTQPSDLKTRIATLMCPCIFKLHTEFEPHVFIFV